MRIALVHDYLTQKGGAERVFELLCHHFPSADIFTSLYDPDKTIELGERLVKTTILQNVPGATKYFRLMAPFYYPVFRALDLQDYDLILSSSTSFAKSVRKGTHAKHICFCHNITRFLWDTQTYLREYADYQRFYPFIEKVFRTLRKIDKTYAQEPDLYIANSTTVQKRIHNTYERPALVINYPIDSQKFSFSDQKDDFYLVSSRLISYKRIDITVKAFNALGLPLVIIGDGPEQQSLANQALPNIHFLGHVSDQKRQQLMSRAKAVVVTALEDYGLVPIEANASGTPVLAYGRGGVLDTQIPNRTGVLFQQQTPDALIDAIRFSEFIDWDYKFMHHHAIKHFSEGIFFEKIDRVITDVCNDRSLETWFKSMAVNVG
ncbi:MAG: glycosyltransferase [Thermosynechococcaceae cyanobacterium]